jgi:pimeloyl-ACP methyl ester carboxylesterase
MPAYDGAGGAALYYDLVGEGVEPPLLVLAGGAARHPTYVGDLAGLGELYRLALPHLRGVGYSKTAPLGEFGSYWRQADDVDLLRISLGLQRCTLVAHSAGTRLAIAYAAQYPDHVDALVLITPPASYLVEIGSDVERIAEARMAEPTFAAAMSTFQTGPDTSSDETFTAWQREAAPIGYASWNETTQAHARCGSYSLDASRAFLSGDVPGDLSARLGRVVAPTLVIAGAQDAIAGVGPVNVLADLFPNGRAEVIERCGHFPWVEQPTSFLDLVDPFLADNG